MSSDGRRHVTTTRVRYGETDKMGVIYHPNFIVYFEMGRTELMRAAGVPYSELERQGCKLVVTEVGCRYRGNARYDEEVTIRTRVAGVGRATVRFEYALEAGGRTIGEGFTVLASVNPDGKPTRLPQGIVDSLRPE